MRKDLFIPGDNDMAFAVPSQESVARVVTQPFTLLLERIAVEKPEMMPNLLKLRELIGAEFFETYINRLQSIRRNETTVMLVTDKEIHKTNIEGRFIRHIEEAFEVEFVRVVSL